MPDQIKLRIAGMDCAECAQTLEHAVGQLDGVTQCQVNFGAARMTVAVDPRQVSRQTITERIRSLGYDVASDSPTQAQPATRGRWRGLWDLLTRRRQNLLTLAAGVCIALSIVASWLGSPASLSQAFSTLAIAIGGYPIARKGVNSLRLAHTLDMNLLMTIAAIGAAAIGEATEGALVVFLFSLGEALEGYTLDQARRSIEALMTLVPPVATILRPCLDCAGHQSQPLPEGGIYTSGPCPWCEPHEESIPVEQLAVGERILVRPGERIAMDGRVLAGRSAVNQAPITGESVPVAKEAGAEVFAGTINGNGALEIAVTRLAADNTLSRIIHMVEEAQGQRAPLQRWVDGFARSYTPAVVAAAVLVAALPPLLWQQPFFDAPGGGHGWLYRALALLVIACPCALVISTPVSIVSAISAAARNGVLIKGGAYLEALGGIKALAFDKTGTLTEGRPALQRMACGNGDGHAASDRCADCDDVLALAAAVERRSEHPLAQAVVDGARTRGVAEAYAAAEDVASLTGRGVRGRVNGQTVTVGSHRFFDAEYAHDAALCDLVQRSEAAGQTTILVHDGDQVRGFLAIADHARVESAAALAQLKAMGIRAIVMLTGDNTVTAQAIAQGVGVDEVHAELLPEDKVAVVRSLLARYGRVAMVGDGVNDAPALAAATVGIAMGGAGTAQAMETADIVLMGDDLSKLPWTLGLSRAMLRTIRQNVAFSLAIKALFLTLALMGVATLWMAVFADTGASLIVTLNGMRLLRQKTSPHKGTKTQRRYLLNKAG